MQITSKNISVVKTARYFLSKEDISNVKRVMFVLHGYGMPALNFLEEFKEINSNDLLIISPEGLSRFYTKGFYGNIGASWMTSEDRENEIADYVNYLDEVSKEVLSGISGKPELIVLGFSQGGSTAARWIAKGNVKADKLIIHSSDIPKDIDLEKLKTVKVNYIYGDGDKSLRKENYERSIELLKEKNIKFESDIFKGGHEVNIEAVKRIL